jgi:hypothetical protein
MRGFSHSQGQSHRFAPIVSASANANDLTLSILINASDLPQVASNHR